MSRQYPIDRKSLYTESDRADSFVGRSTPYTRAGTDVTKRKNQAQESIMPRAIAVLDVWQERQTSSGRTCKDRITRTTELRPVAVTGFANPSDAKFVYRGTRIFDH
jgi:hypothetical protein